MTTYIKLYKRHQTGKIGWWEGEVQSKFGSINLIFHSAGSADAKPVRAEEHDIKGKNIGKANETTPFQQACKELESKANKKRDQGYAASMEDVSEVATNTLGFIRPQKAVAFTDMSDRQLDKIDWANAHVQRKYDGHRAMVKDGVMYSSGGKVIDLPHMKGLPTELHLDGELYIHGMPLTDIGRLISKYRPGETEKLKYVVFDVVDMGRAFSQRFSKTIPLPRHSAIECAQTYQVTCLEQVLKYHKQFVAEGYEGAMLRQGTNGYKGGARTSDILKFKEMTDAEWLVTEVEESKGKLYKGKILRQARLRCYCPKADKYFTVLAPGTVPQKRLPLIYPNDFIGKMLTVQHFGFTVHGLPNLPVAKCIREDV